MDYRERLLRQLNAAAGAAGPWFLGKSFSALDLYVAVMCNWRPGRAWFRQHCPRLYAIAERVEQRPELNALLSAHFDGVARWNRDASPPPGENLRFLNRDC